MENKNLFDFDFTQEESTQELNADSSGYKLIFFDTETTGANSDDQIIEIGAICENSSQEYTLYNELCGVEDNKLIELGAMATHGIRNEDIEALASFRESKFYKDLALLNNQNNYLIAHNLPFDLARLEYYGFSSNLKHIDTLQCAKHLYEIDEPIGELEYALPNYKLQTFRYALFSKEDEELEAKRYNISLMAHRAIGDVVVLKMFFSKLLEKLDASLSTKEKLDELVRLSKEPILVKKFAFGKYKGKEIKEVYKIDSGYIDWLYRDITKRLNSGDSIDENLYSTLKKVVGQ
jgi:DNA polymerase-3 subunit epsilon/exodeoxyribonuclease X